MQEAKVDILSTDSLSEAVAKVEKGYEQLGASLLAFENLNTFLPISPFCRFFQASFPDREVVLVVMTGAWEEKVLLTILNVLLEIRMDPDPPGRLPSFRFHATETVPPVLQTLFGDAPVSEFESRAVLVVHFGRDLEPTSAMQFAGVAKNLLRECLGVSADFFDTDSVLRLDETVVDGFRQAGLAEDGAPLNALVSLGFLYGELLRERFGYPSTWLRLQKQGPWPVLVFGAQLAEGDSEVEKTASGTHVVFNPIGTLISLYKEGKAGRLGREAEELERRLTAELEAPTPRA
jgi:hypothetical protein